MANTTTKKFTKASLKAFISKNFKADNLFVLQRSTFDGMQDCCVSTKGRFLQKVKALDARNPENTYGVEGLWVVDGRNLIQNVSANYPGFEAYEVYNCCGCCVVARRVEA